MARATIDEIVDILKRDYPKFIVCPPEAEDEALSVYPPKSYHDDHGVDVFLEGPKASIWLEDWRMKTIPASVGSEAMAKEIIARLDSIQENINKELEG